jgi:hypothetical protein
MGKRVTHARKRLLESRIGMTKERLYVACDDGSTYLFERERGSPRWYALKRIDRDGSHASRPSRLPAAVEAHMDGRTCSGPFGETEPDYWET